MMSLSDMLLNFTLKDESTDKLKLLSFDIELSDIVELKKHEDINKYAPFHISVAATAVHGGEEKVWYSEKEKGCPLMNLTQQRAHELLEYLDKMQRDGYMVCAWNGLGFDLKWIGYQANDQSLAARIALKSYDPMFQFFSQTGFPVGLAKVAQAMKISQEKLMDGADAPKEWQAGNYQKVMDYCLGDCQMTNLVVLAILKKRRIDWVTNKRTIKSSPIPHIKSVEDVIQGPDPDQSWIDNPIPRTNFYGWVRHVMETKGLKKDMISDTLIGKGFEIQGENHFVFEDSTGINHVSVEPHQIYIKAYSKCAPFSDSAVLKLPVEEKKDLIKFIRYEMISGR